MYFVTEQFTPRLFSIVKKRCAWAKYDRGNDVENFILIYRLILQIQISLIIGKSYSADEITGTSGEKRWMKK